MPSELLRYVYNKITKQCYKNDFPSHHIFSGCKDDNSVFTPNPDNCQHYFLCSSGNITGNATCPDGQVFDPEERTYGDCRDAWDVPCSGTNQ